MLKIKYRRLNAGLSQTKLGKSVGVQPTLIGQIERGAVKPGEELALRLAKALQVDNPLTLFEEMTSDDD